MLVTIDTLLSLADRWRAKRVKRPGTLVPPPEYFPHLKKRVGPLWLWMDTAHRIPEVARASPGYTWPRIVGLPAACHCQPGREWSPVDARVRWSGCSESSPLDEPSTPGEPTLLSEVWGTVPWRQTVRESGCCGEGTFLYSIMIRIGVR